MNMISAHKLGKCYKRYSSRNARLLEWLTKGRYIAHQSRWVLKNLNFQIQKGESVGIIGQNGAGKSTLLKILTGTTFPSEGKVRINGVVSALLELGLGFHPEFSGRANAVMICQMLGLDKQEALKILPAIEAFSELGDYFDQPIRVYSTGMQVRLAFSAATAIQPDILIIDEALSVGDAYFQHKCIRRIREFKDKGATFVFVSHDAAAVKSLCDRAILIDNGKMIHDDTPDTVLNYYNGMIAKKHADDEILQVEADGGYKVTRSGSGEVRIKKIEIFDEKNCPSRSFQVDDLVKIRCQIQAGKMIDNPTVGILIRDRLGNDIFGTNTYHQNKPVGILHKDEIVGVEFSLNINFGYGAYSLSVAIHASDSHIEANYDWWDRCLVFKVLPGKENPFVGVCATNTSVNINGRK